jgi:protein-disulfide isomerase
MTDTVDPAITDLPSSPDPGLPGNPAGLAGPAPAPAGVTVFYDGACPFCSAYVRMVRLRKAAGEVRLIDAREGGPIVMEALSLG